MRSTWLRIRLAARSRRASLSLPSEPACGARSSTAASGQPRPKAPWPRCGEAHHSQMDPRNPMVLNRTYRLAHGQLVVSSRPGSGTCMIRAGASENGCSSMALDNGKFLAIPRGITKAWLGQFPGFALVIGCEFGQRPSDALRGWNVAHGQQIGGHLRSID